MRSVDIESARYLDEPYPLDHAITWREHYARKPEAFHWTHSTQCDCNKETPHP